jgi:hypothetical protein
MRLLELATSDLVAVAGGEPIGQMDAAGTGGGYAQDPKGYPTEMYPGP